MIYVCIPSYDEAPTIGLLLWKIRQVFAAFPREYQLLVLDDGSTDTTAEVLEPYARVLPLTVIRRAERQGYAASVEELLRKAVDLTDRPKRDMRHPHARGLCSQPADRFPISSDGSRAAPTWWSPRGGSQGEPSRGHRMLRRYAPSLAPRRGLGAIGERHRLRVRRLPAGGAAQRDPEPGGPLLHTEGWAANAELFWRAARYARRVETVSSVERHDLRRARVGSSRGRPPPASGRPGVSCVRFPVPPAPPEASPRREAEPQAVSS